MKFRSMLALCVSLFLLLIASPSLLAQTAGTGALSGTVTDPSGAVVPNVTVTATSVDTGAVRTATTGGDGSYIISLLQPGNYRVRFDAAGFKPVEVPSVTITVTENGTLNQALTVGAQTQEVTIQADVETVQTSNGAVGTVVNNVAEIPLATRNYVNLLGLSAGANSTINNAASALGKGTQSIAVNGAATSDNNYQMDGVSVVTFQSSGGVGEAGTFSAFGVPNPDAVQEFKIQTSSFDASYGRNSGGNVNMVTKAGTNEFHGNLFEYFRNTVLNANDFFKKDSEVCAHSATGVSSFFGCTPGQGPYAGNAANIRPAVDQNQYGATFGGPIKKDKLFVFLSYQETDQKNGLATAGFSTFTLPYISPASFGPRGSNAWLVDMYNHYCGQAGGAGGGTGIEFEPAPVSIGGSGVCPNPGTPAKELASIGPNPLSPTNTQPLSVLEIAAPSATTNGTAYYVPSVLDLPKTSTVQCGLTGRTLSNGTSLDPLNYSTCTSSIPAIYHEYQGVGNFDYVVNSKNTLSGRFFSSIDPTLSPFGVGGSVPGFPAHYQALNDEAILRLTTVLSNNMVNEARISFQRNAANDSEGAPFTSSSVGIQPVSPNVELFPQTNTGGFSMGAYQFGVANSLDNQYEYADQLSYTHGKQTLRFGFEAERDLWNYSFPALDIGALTFTNFADFLTDLPSSPTIGAPTTDLAGHVVQGNGTGSSSLAVGSATTLFSTPALNGPGSTLGYDHHYRATSFDSFVQDDVKINKRLTVNLGLRWEWDGYVTELEGENVTVDDSRMLGVPFTFTTGAATIAPCVGVVYPAPCPGGTLQGFVVPRNFNTSILGAIPTNVAQRSHDYASAAVPPKDDFAPRFGFAWQPLSTNKFVVRGGAGFFYNRIPGDNYIHTVLQNFPTAYTIPSFINADLAWPYGIPKAGWGYRWVYTPTGGNTLSSQLGGGGLEMSEKLTVPLVYEWSLNTQYEFLRGWVLEVGYVGSHGIHQFTTGQDINLSALVSAALPAANGSGATTNTTGNTALRVVYPGFSNGYTNEATVGSFLYNSAQVTLRKQMSHGLLFQAAYTFSRGYTATPLGYGNPNADLPGQYPEITAYVPNAAYHPQRLAVTYSYDLPFGHHSGLVGKATEGWTVSGITIIQDGTPLTVTDSRLGTIFGAGNTAAQFCGGATLSQIETPGSLFDRVVSGLTGGNGYINKTPFSSNSTTGGNIINCSQFFPVAANAATNPLWANFGNGAGDGNGPVGGFLGPGQFNTDVTLLKSTRVGGLREDGTLIFRAEFLNAFNHPQFSNPTVAMGGSLGKITSASVNPRLIQFALKYQF